MIKIISYNILADSLADSFPNVDPELLQWSVRSRRILEQLRTLAPIDVICLVECDHYDFFKRELESEYEGVFEQKRSEQKKDGTAIFWCKKTISLVEQLPTLRLLSDQSQTATILRFQHKETEKQFIFIGTHLKSDEFIKSSLLKTAARITRKEEIESLFRSLPSNENENTIIVGDFNDEPDSPVCQLMIDQGFTSLYPLSTPFTTFKKRVDMVKHMIDYIWFGPAFTAGSYDPLPEEKDLPEQGLPSAEFPSDHLMISGNLCLE